MSGRRVSGAGLMAAVGGWRRVSDRGRAIGVVAACCVLFGDFDLLTCAFRRSPPAGHHSSAAFPLSRFPAFPLSRFPAFPLSRFPAFPLSRFPAF
ncbi:hypothetical protein K6W62_03490, partial [Burkholderia multivorans]|nr:hypothetical protein [Burkholderia multivorans]